MTTNLIENRQIRIFISSTFRDMMAERDYLVTKIFPALRRYCESRDVSLFELDLRWGISEEESKQGKVVDICLKEIQKTTPFFIGLLGDRYGWVPNEAEQDVIAKNTDVFTEHPWINAELDSGTSITEIEIQEGVLRAQEKVNAYFYFRSPSVEVPEDFREKPGSREAQKLDKLKFVLRGQNDYPVKDYESIEDLGKKVEADFRALVDRLFPEGALSELEKERLEQKIFLKNRTTVYVPNPALLGRLDEFAGSAERALVVTGGGGMGKSALLANWIAGREGSDEKIIYHFIGQSRAEGDYRKISDRFINELKNIYATAGSPGVDDMEAGGKKGGDDKRKEELQNLFFAVPKDRRLIIILEGVDKLTEDKAKLLGWLPAFPEHVKFVFSTEETDVTMNYFRRMEYGVLPVPPLDTASRETLIVDYLATFGKKLTPERVKRIAVDNESGNPLALRALLDELRMFGVHEQIDERIDHYLAAESIPALFALVLERLEETYNYGGNNFVRDALSLIYASRSGLSEAELLSLTGAAPIYWSQLSAGMGGSLQTRNGLAGFSHGYIRDAVKARYLSRDGDADEYRRRIAALMQSSETAAARRFDELPYQLFTLKDWDGLYECLLDFDAFDYLYKKDEYELGAYWRALREVNSEKYRAEKYLELDSGGKSQKELGGLFNTIGWFFSTTIADYPLAKTFCEKSIAIQEEVLGKKHPDTAASYHNIGIVYSSQGDYPAALEYHQKALAILEEVLGKKHPATATSYNNIGNVYSGQGDYPAALEYYRKALAIQEEVLGKNHPATAGSYHNIGLAYENQGDYTAGLEYYKKALAIQEEVLGKKHPDTASSYNNIGGVYSHQGDYTAALEYCKKALAIKEEVLGKNHPDTAMIHKNLTIVKKRQIVHFLLSFILAAAVYAVCRLVWWGIRALWNGIAGFLSWGKIRDGGTSIVPWIAAAVGFCLVNHKPKKPRRNIIVFAAALAVAAGGWVIARIISGY